MRTRRVRHLGEGVLESEENFRAMSDLAPVMMWICDSHGRHFHLNRKLREFLGMGSDAYVRLDWRANIHPDDVAKLEASISQAIAHCDEVRVKARYKGDKDEYRVVEVNVTPRYSAKGTFIGLVGVITDVTDRDRAEARRNLLTAELGHRVKNILAVVLSIAHRTLRSANSLDDAREMFEGRMISLAQAHNILTEGGDGVASMVKLVAEGFAAHGIDQRRANAFGPEIMLPPGNALSLALVLHELCTNALKYGALSDERGVIDLRWSLAGGELCVIWKERGGPSEGGSTRRGFGSLLIERALSDVCAKFERSFDPAGLVFRIAMQVPRTAEKPVGRRRKLIIEETTR